MTVISSIFAVPLMLEKKAIDNVKNLDTIYDRTFEVTGNFPTLVQGGAIYWSKGVATDVVGDKYECTSDAPSWLLRNNADKYPIILTMGKWRVSNEMKKDFNRKEFSSFLIKCINNINKERLKE